MHMPSPPNLLSTREVAVLLAATVSTVNRWAAAGTLVSEKLPGRTGSRVFRLDDVEAFRDSEKVAS